MSRRLHTAALCRALPTTGELPEWIALLPAGPDIQGIDGRKWKLRDPARVVAAFNSDIRGRLPVDLEHATELLAPNGHAAPAFAWVVGLEARADGVWGRVEWTPPGAELAKNRQYQFISPVFLHTADGEIVSLSSAALTNSPNLQLPALNRAGEHGEAMPTKLLELLALPATTTEEQLVAAVSALKTDLATARNRAETTPDLTKFVPRADFDAAMNRANTVAKELETFKAAQLDAEIQTEIDAAVRAGKITPGTVDFYKATCRAEGGLAKFREFVKAAPVVAPDSGLGGKKPAAQGEKLTELEKATCAAMGISHEQFLKARGA